MYSTYPLIPGTICVNIDMINSYCKKFKKSVGINSEKIKYFTTFMKQYGLLSNIFT